MTPVTTIPKHDIKDASLAAAGRKKIEWAERNMPVLAQIRERFEKSQPFAGVRIAACMHVTTETANLMRVLKAGGAEIALCASNPLSTQDDTAAALVHEYGISVFARNAVDRDGYYSHINAALDIQPHQVFDDGCDLVNTLHTTRKELLPNIAGGCEETTTGVIRLKAMAKSGPLGLATNESDKREIVLYANALETGGDDVQILRVAKAHDQHRAAGREMLHRRMHRVGMFGLHIHRQDLGEDALAAIEPRDIEGQAGQELDEGMAHMPPAKERQGLDLRAQALQQVLQVPRADGVVAQMHHTATALAQGGPQGVTQYEGFVLVVRGRRWRVSECGCCLAAEQGSGLRDGLVLQVAAAQGIDGGVGKNRHPSPLLARP